MGTYYAIAGLYDPVPESSQWYSEVARDKAITEAVRQHNENGGPLHVIKVTTETFGITGVAFKEHKKEESDDEF